MATNTRTRSRSNPHVFNLAKIDRAKVEELYALLAPLRVDFHSDAQRLVVADWLDENLPLTETTQEPLIPNWFRLNWLRSVKCWHTAGWAVLDSMRETKSFSPTGVQIGPEIDHYGTASIFGVPCFVSEPYGGDRAALLALRGIAHHSDSVDIFTRRSWHEVDSVRLDAQWEAQELRRMNAAQKATYFAKKAERANLPPVQSSLRRVILFPRSLDLLDARRK
jgi:hypothetical protein